MIDDPEPWHEHLRSARFCVRTREEAAALAATLAVLMPDRSIGALALTELLVNAVEHGNLAIGGALKAQLLRRGTLEDEVSLRLDRPPYRDREVEVVVSRHATGIEIEIIDQGDGFDWATVIAAGAASEPSTAPNGRGLQLVRALACADLEWNERGNRVTVRSRR
jgi:anti-sigma regulatory factor (Ser/Thr protein kinase)